MKKVEAEVLEAVLKKIRALRAWAVITRIDPWAFRQGLILALELDREAALRRGVSREDLAKFDELVRRDVSEWVRTLGC